MRGKIDHVEGFDRLGLVRTVYLWLLAVLNNFYVGSCLLTFFFGFMEYNNAKSARVISSLLVIKMSIHHQKA